MLHVVTALYCYVNILYSVCKMSINNKVMTSEKGCDVTSDEEEVKCGYCSWKPSWLQNCNNPRTLLACLCWFTFTQGTYARMTSQMQNRMDKQNIFRIHRKRCGVRELGSLGEEVRIVEWSVSLDNQFL